MRKSGRVLTLFGALAMVAVVAAEERRFDAPRHNAYRVDACRAWGRGCGQAAADAFCLIHDFEKAASFEIDPKIGAKTPTMTLEDKRVCNQPQCDGFKSITCTRATPKLIVSPGMMKKLDMPTPSKTPSAPNPPAPGKQPTPTPPPAPTPTPAPAPTPTPTPPSPGIPPPTLPAGTGDPDEFVVVYPRSADAILGRLGTKAAAGQLEERRIVSLSISSDMFQVEARDFDGDGQTDLAVLEMPNPLKPGHAEFRFLKFNDPGGFVPLGQPLTFELSQMPFLTAARLRSKSRFDAVVYAPGGAVSVVTVGAVPVGVPWNPKGTVIAIDTTGDGIDELLDYADPAGTLDLVSLSAVSQGGGGALTPTIKHLMTLGPGRRLAVGDFRGLGKHDLLIHDSITGDVAIARSRLGEMLPPEKIASGWGPSLTWTRGYDYDGDRRDDLLVADPVNGVNGLVRFTLDGGIRDDKHTKEMMRQGSLLFPGSYTGTGRASVVAMARDLKNKVVHVLFDGDGNIRASSTLIEQLPDGGIIVAGNFVKGR